MRSEWRSRLALILALGAGCATQPASSSAPASASAQVFPNPSWGRWSRPEDAGWRSAGLDSVRAMLAKLPSTGFIAIVGGRELMKYGDLKAVSYLASVRKSVLSMVIGNYVRSGKLRLDKTLAEIGLDDVGGLTPAEKEATVLDLLTARSGIYHAASNPGDDLASAPPRGSQKHGTYQLYNNWDFNALGAVFERETGRNIYDAVQTDLAIPIGMEDYSRAAQQKSGDTTRSIHLAYHMNFSTRDMARIGYLMLREGNWAGKQVIPRDWVRESTRAFTPVSEMHPEARRSGPFGYGYLWWIWDGAANSGAYRGAFSGLGAVGQHITVLPALDLVVAHKTRPGQGRSVSHEDFLNVLDQLVRARLPKRAEAGVVSKPREIRALSIVPTSPRACPGEVINAHYIAQQGDGSRVQLSRGDLSSLVLRGTAADPRPADGSWQTNPEPLVSAVSGFRLSAMLASDTTVRADTVVAPTYDCARAAFAVAAGELAPTTYVRLGTFATPFHDSIVVAVVESSNHTQTVTVLGPRQMSSGAIKINATGANGRPGRAGKPGSTGLACSDGDDGGDGGDGENGQAGGRVDIIVQSGAQWLEKLVAVTNTGGIGGAAGPPGRGGGPGSRTTQGDGRCTSRGGRNGNAGRRGVDGPAGLPPKTSSIPLPLLWAGSPIWTDSAARRALEALMAYDAKPHRE